MIIQEKEKEWELVKQHDHARISWQIINNWNPEWFAYPSRKKEVLLGVRHHDRAWISIDEQLQWDEEKEEPYNFTTYPLTEKLAAYKKGINEVESMSSYAALLCSEHYTSFFKNKENKQPVIYQFLNDEKQRREKIMIDLKGEVTPEEIKAHVKMLQFGDDLSLYMCLNTPGVRKENEYPWFKNGFRQRFSFAPDGINAEWKSESVIQLSPFPLEDETEITLPFYKIKKENSITKNWTDALPQKRGIKLTKKLLPPLEI